MNMKSQKQLIFAIGAAFGLTACFGGNVTWTTGEWTVAEYSYSESEFEDNWADGCGLAAHLDAMDKSLFTYTLGAPPDRSDPNYNPNDTGDERDVYTSDSGNLSADDVTAGQADLWNLCSTPSPSFDCTFALELVHQDQWLDSFSEDVCAEGWTRRINSHTRGLILNKSMLLTNTDLNLACENTETGEYNHVCSSRYSTRLVSPN
jgi:hypothetical protein